ncbi:MAG TPA: cadmium-translocating P-type ATPase [bacterium]|nr:cadmium-translocating P-type ATPase [bacterium]
MLMKKYSLNNLDCADCALKIENGLSRLDSVESVSINFATASMHIETESMDKVVAAIRHLEPDVEVADVPSGPGEDEAGPGVLKNLLPIGISVVIFVLGMVFKKSLHNTAYSYGEYLVFIAAYLSSGWGVLATAGKNIIKGKIFDEHFLMTIATLGAIAIHALPEAAGVMIFFKVGEFFEHLALVRSRKLIKSLLEIKPDYANLKKGSNYVKVDPEMVNVGDTILVKPGERVPLDGKVVSGRSQVDTSALTGESVPRSLEKGDIVLSGMIVKSGSLTIVVTRSFQESSVSKILDLVENAIHNKAETEKFITTFARYYTPIVVFLALSVAILPPLLISGAGFAEWIYRALVILVISCPCALVISIPLGYFGGIGGASARGILIKGSNYIDILSRVNTVVFDKTGTLTRGNFKVTDIVVKNGFSREDTLKYAALAESHSNHPLAESIKEAYGRAIDPAAVEDYQEISGLGIKAVVLNTPVVVGNDRLLHLENIPHEICDLHRTVAHVVVDSTYAGYIVVSDEVKEDAGRAIAELETIGVKNIIMLTGDNEQVAKDVSRSLGIKRYHSGLLPEDKVRILTAI